MKDCKIRRYIGVQRTLNENLLVFRRRRAFNDISTNFNCLDVGNCFCAATHSKYGPSHWTTVPNGKQQFWTNLSCTHLNQSQSLCKSLWALQNFSSQSHFGDVIQFTVPRILPNTSPSPDDSSKWLHRLCSTVEFLKSNQNLVTSWTLKARKKRAKASHCFWEVL